MVKFTQRAVLVLVCARPFHVSSFAASTLGRTLAPTALLPPRRGKTTAMFSSSTKAEVTQIPEFATKDEYLKFMESQSALPKGFSIGTAKGTFVSVEAPGLGNLPIKATVVKFDQPTESWAACFTKNKVSCFFVSD
jgi:hypothetical protein